MRCPNKIIEYKCRCGNKFTLKKKVAHNPLCPKCVHDIILEKHKNAKYHTKEKYKNFARNWELKNRYNITKEEYDKLLILQNNVCAICKNEDKKHTLCVDHDHKTGKIRGLLCHRCNRSIGSFLDDVQLLENCISYLKIKGSVIPTPPSWDEWFMRHVYLVSEKSKDPKTKIGAVIVKENHIISSGYNGFPIGVNDLPERYDDRQIKYSMISHAEDNSVITAARFGISTKDTTLYTQGIPCNECAKSIIQSGIKEVVIHKQWPSMIQKWIESCKISEQMLSESGVKIRWFDKLLGISGWLDGQFVNV